MSRSDDDEIFATAVPRALTSALRHQESLSRSLGVGRHSHLNQVLGIQKAILEATRNASSLRAPAVSAAGFPAFVGGLASPERFSALSRSLGNLEHWPGSELTSRGLLQGQLLGRHAGFARQLAEIGAAHRLADYIGLTGIAGLNTDRFNVAQASPIQKATQLPAEMGATATLADQLGSLAKQTNAGSAFHLSPLYSAAALAGRLGTPLGIASQLMELNRVGDMVRRVAGTATLGALGDTSDLLRTLGMEPSAELVDELNGEDGEDTGILDESSPTDEAMAWVEAQFTELPALDPSTKDGQRAWIAACRGFLHSVKEKHPAAYGSAKWLVLLFLGWLLQAGALPRLFPQVAPGSMSPPSSTSPADCVRKTRREVWARGLAPDQLAHVRIVSKEETAVWLDPQRGKKSSLRLPLGQQVVLMEKKRGVSFVAFSSPALGVSGAGWVKSKYLQPVGRF